MTDLYGSDLRTPKGVTRKDFLRSMGMLAIGTALAGPLGGTSGAMAQAAETPKKGGVFNFNLTASPPNFDPLSNSSGTILSCIAPCYSGLVRFDPLHPDAVISDAARDWKVSPDGKTYTFTLFDNIKFHDGTPLTSADVVFSLERIRNPPKGVVSVRQTSFDVVDTIAAPDPGTVVVTLKHSSFAFVNSLASGWTVILSKHFVEGGGDPKKTVMGSGPFKFKEYIDGVSIELVRNPNYFVPDRPYLDGVKLFIIPDQGATWNYLQSGQLQMWQSIQGTEAGQYQSDSRIDIVKAPSTSMVNITFNTAIAPFNNPELRKAAVLAIDRNAALQILQRGQGVFGGPVAPGPWAVDDAALSQIPGYGHDTAANLAEAKRIMAGIPGPLSARVLVRRIALFEPVGVFLKDQWSKIGINVQLDVQENAAFFTSMAGMKFQALANGASTNTSDPDDAGSWFQCNSPQNVSGLCDASSDQLFAQMSGETDPVKRKDLAVKWQLAVAAQNAQFFLFWRERFMGLRRNVHGMIVHPNIDNNDKLQDVWLS